MSRRKRLLPTTILFVSALLFADAVFMTIVDNFHIGMIIVGIFSLAFGAYGVLLLRNKANVWLHVLVASACVVLVAFSCFLAVFGARSTVRYNEDALIVLGAGIHGEQVTSTLARRMDKAIEYHRKNPDAVIVVSGGRGPQEDITEALAMKGYLVREGVSPGQILREEKSTSTYENFALSDELLSHKLPPGYAVAFITSDYHIYRAEKIARSAGISARRMGAPIDWYTAPINYAREMLAVAKLWLLGSGN